MLAISCLCKKAALEVALSAEANGKDIELSFCHCTSCRHSTGLLFTSYLPIKEPHASQIDGLSRHTSEDGWTRLFCPNCGCHVLRVQTGEGEESTWEVATGVIEKATEDDEKAFEAIKVAGNINVGDTVDGGASVWLPPKNDPQAWRMDPPTPCPEVDSSSPGDAPADTLPASCACGKVDLYITRPNPDSYLASSGWPDLTHAYHSISEPERGNPEDIKWWIRDNGNKYLAGTCACRSCRLVSGFEIQTWTFVPRTNIHFRVPGPAGNGASDGRTTVALDFKTLPRGILQSYESSPGVLREFCPGCGATVFWHDKWRPNIIDVSVGLLRAREGARADGWLDWWTERVSFAEDAEVGRVGPPAQRAVELVSRLQTGLGLWTQ
ncbi:unnamed protein product [Parascedosporium putredinis]|uniref:CENP-V/GFA domain-containing protein n=1 Tax=Parascedosporium putredinis TaxID=1442378 RepID=A0A9P1HAI3_9PEZI|nr:unnamed protein product [Parascedosporium putredinis]CAI8002769.1 unnamed protein product [Parascedosporium putredinis]